MRKKEMRISDLSLKKNIWSPVCASEVARFGTGGERERPPVTILRCWPFAHFGFFLAILHRILKTQEAVINFAWTFSISLLTSRIHLFWNNPHVPPVCVRDLLASLCTLRCSPYESKPQQLFPFLIFWPQSILYFIKPPLTISKQKRK